MKTTLLAALSLLACGRGGAGTFVGNPTMSARLAEPEELPVIDGLLVAPEVLLGDCDGVGDVPLGSRNLSFEGPLSDDTFQIPTGSHCGVFFVVDAFTIRIDEGAPQATTIVADDFDLWIETRFEAETDSRHSVRFGDSSWLAAIAEVAEPGENLVNGENPELYEAFFSGLSQSAVESEQGGDETALPDDIPGRIDTGTYTASPSGTPTTYSGCGPGVNYDLAVPVPGAAMAALGLSQGEIGWCEANVLFSEDLTPQSAVQVDYRDGSLFEVPYNGFSQGCGALHCGSLYSASGAPLDRPCTALALCSESVAVVTGFLW